jgi:hypothetical protein
MSDIDWSRVNDNLRCPACGDRAHISGGTNGTEAEHTHRFPVSRELARRLSQPSPEEVQRRIKELETELESLRGNR